MRSNFVDILKHKVEIPIIQRDYAQGRTDSKTIKIRKDFLDVLFDFIQEKAKGSNEEKELDFIYGFDNGDGNNYLEFIPIDGQQRLTTLWLLYWFIAAKEKIEEKEKVFLSNFVYETRHSTTQFCKELIKFSPDFTNSSISSEIKNQSWYFETWDYDPSIQAMLVVLNDIESRFNEIGLTNIWDKIGNNSCPFYFYKLDMKKVGLTDDLYIKMNSRGKPLTEFEYFKAGFSELISDTKQRKEFGEKVDGIWIDTIWQIVNESRIVNSDDDIALTVDNAFLNLFNFITSVIAFKKDIKSDEGLRYTNTVNSSDLLALIYSDQKNLKFLFESFDAVCEYHLNHNTFWSETFYFDKTGFETNKVRLFFQHKEHDLLKRCLIYFAENRGFSYQEQLFLLACVTHFKNPTKDFSDRIRKIRNLVVNSENELRESSLGNSFNEVEKFILNGDLNVFKNFKTDQIEEEKQKETFLKNSPKVKHILQRLEDSDIFRGSISLFPFDKKFGNRAEVFQNLFDEDDFIKHFCKKSNLLLCFGDYSQDEYSLINLMAGNIGVIRDFLTTPGYNKNEFISKTRVVLMDCLDYFKLNNAITVEEKIADTLNEYVIKPKDWIYYFIKYDSFRNRCFYGFYYFITKPYRIYKMGKKQLNGYHWDPFLHEVYLSLQPSELTLDNYGNKLLIHSTTDKIWISTVENGFQFENASGTEKNKKIDTLRHSGKLNKNDILEILQDKNGIDLEDRIEKLKNSIKDII